VWLLLVATGPVARADGDGAEPFTALMGLVDDLGRTGYSGVIAARDGEGQMRARALGFAVREQGITHHVNERWPWASVTKQVTAALVMAEVDAGRLALDARLSAVLPAFTGPTADRITVRDLLRHTSGLPNPDEGASDADGVPGFYRERGPGIGDRARALGFCAGPPRSAPGAPFAYNNCDYLVLAALLERTTGRPFAALVNERIARPHGLRTLRAADDGAKWSSGVVGYDGPARAPAVNLATYGAAGALVGSATDLLAFDALLLDRRLVSDASTREMWRGDPSLGYVALGAWSFTAPLRGCADPVELIERRGEIAGVVVRNLLAPARARALVAFSNDASQEFGEIWQGKGLAFDLASAAFCAP
jgi:CubicO group peptidase (beta-lactamase class C family)